MQWQVIGHQMLFCSPVLLTGCHATPLVTRFCLLISVTYLTPCHLTGHQVSFIHQYYLLDAMSCYWPPGNLPLIYHYFFKHSLGSAAQPQSHQGFLLQFITQPCPHDLLESCSILQTWCSEESLFHHVKYDYKLLAVKSLAVN